MAQFLSDEWFVAVADAGAQLAEAPGLSFTFDIEVPEAASGKVRGHGSVVDGRITSFVAGKAPAPVEVSLIAKNKRALPVVLGHEPPLVAYMLGHVKIEGAYEIVIDRLVNEADSTSLQAFGDAVAAATDV